MAKIEDLLHRRNDLSTFLVHLTRDTLGGPGARDQLLSIAGRGVIEARNALGPAKSLEEHLAGSSATQKVVCFTETPLEHAWMMLEDIEGRSVHLQPYGIALTKTTARRAHFNPVWYSDISTRGGRSWPSQAVNTLIQEAVSRATCANGVIDVERMRQESIFKITPFFEQMGPMSNGGRKEFWWEREWRHVGNYVIPDPTHVVAIFAPAMDHVALRRELTQRNAGWRQRPILDPRWGLERMIASLANISDEDIGPFPVAQ